MRTKTFTNFYHLKLHHLYCLLVMLFAYVSANAQSMTYVSSTTTQKITSSVGVGSANNVIIGVEVVMTPTGTPVNLTQLDLSTLGTVSLTDISNLKVWYTGSNSLFTTGNQFGSTVSTPAATASVTGSQGLTTGVNYFWVTYDIASAAVVPNAVDGECSSLTVDGNVQTPSVSAPAGTRAIRPDYCNPTYANPCSSDDYINNLWTSGALTNVTNLSSGCNGNPNNRIFYPNMVVTVAKTGSFTINYQCDVNTFDQGFKIYIDFDQDGVYSASEEVASAPSSFDLNTTTITIPCTALPGFTRMRVRCAYNTTPGGPCSSENYGEVEEYPVNIVENPIAYVSSTAVQQVASVFPGANNKPVLRIGVLTAGCGVAIPSDFVFSTAGSTTAGDIVAAKLYSTGSSNVFNTSKLLSTVVTPSGSFTMSTTDTLESSAYTYYWLAYDVNATATLSNVLDATFDSVNVLGQYRIPTVSSPAGNLLITAPMTFISAEGTQLNAISAGRGTTDNEVMGIHVITSIGAPIDLTQFDLSANGTTDTSKISDYKVWYTGNSNIFAKNNQFGSTVPSLSGTNNYSVTGFQSLVAGDNYFWVTYTIDASATIGDAIDGEVLGMVISGTPQVPSTTAPTGNRLIRDDYCTPILSSGNGCNWNSYINTFTTTGGITDITAINNGCSGVNFNNNQYYPGQTLTIAQNQTFQAYVETPFTWLNHAIWIDYNQDGIFDNGSERVFITPLAGDFESSLATITIPCSALPGSTRMRVRAGEYFWWFPSIPVTDACADYGVGETEDYDVVILSSPISYAGSDAEQIAGSTYPGQLNREVLHVPVKTTGCGIITATSLNFSTTGTTNNGDIVNAKLYNTGASDVFNTSNLIATVAAPTSQFAFSVTDTLVTNDVTHYWLAYDINAAATIGNIIDARFDSIEAAGTFHAPLTSAPAGNITITNPMSYVGSDAIQTNVFKVGRGTADNEVVGLRLIMSSSGAPVHITQLDLSANGTTDTSKMRDFKVWYTGSSSTFGAYQQFGSTLNMLPGTLGFNVTGDQALLNDTNYFWLTYSIDASATIGDIMDGEVTGMTIHALTHSPAITAPAGNRQIRENYCTPVLINGLNSCLSWQSYINTFTTTGAEVDITNVNNGCAGNANNNTYYQGTNQLVVKQNTSFQAYVETPFSWLGHAVWIDYDQDGIFNNTNERVFMSPGSGSFESSTFNVSVPCTALPGPTRMRVRASVTWMTGSAPNNPCSDFNQGETEDYDVIILNNPVVYANSDAEQLISTAYPGELSKKILHIPVQTLGCGSSVSTDFVFSTTGTTNNADIVAAKLYQTGNSGTFNTSNLIGTVAAPGSQFSIAVTDTLVANDITHYWLAYDINATATLGNVVDARFDSLQVDGDYHIPTTTAPAGNITLANPMTYVSSEAIQPNTLKVGRGTADNDVLGIRVIMSSTGASIKATSLDLSANGTTDTATIRNFKVWYTGSSSTFAAVNQFGSTLNMLPGTYNFAIAGEQQLGNDTNYFWLTYDIDGAAVIGDDIDGEASGITILGTTQPISLSAPAGSREIRENYCIPLIFNGPNSCFSWQSYITTFTTNGGLTDITNVNNSCSGNANNYTYFKGTELVVKQNTTFQAYVETPFNWLGHTVWIDYNQDGIFNNVDERVFMSPGSSSFQSSTFNVTVPCTALPGPTRMRVRASVTWMTGTAPNNPCSDFNQGESEDYDVMIINNPVVFDNTEAEQQTGNTFAGDIDKPVLHIPIQTLGCGTLTSTNFAFSTTGTTNNADITSAKLYRTANGSFNSSDLVATVAAPGSQFTFTITDTLVSNDVTHYWLTYDINAGATLGNTVDARFDSVEIGGTYFIPSVTNPAGNIIISTPMAYVSADAIQTNLTKAGRGTTNNDVLGLHIVMSATGASVKTSQIDFNVNGTTDTSKVRNFKVWYSGSSNVFSAANQFGATLDYLPGTLNFSVSGDQSLTNGDNYFWLTYDIDAAANLGDFIDGEVTGVVIAGTPQIPSTTAAAGAREIRENYCVPQLSSGTNSCLSWNEYINTVSTSGATVNFSNVNNSCAGNANNYTYFQGTTVTVTKTQTFQVYVETPFSWLSHAVWIDFDQDGIFNNTNERVFVSAGTNTYQSSTVSITVPCTAGTGLTRMRVRAAIPWWSGTAVNNPCTNFGEGESEDYDIMILDNPASFNSTTTIQQTGTIAVGAVSAPVLRIPVQTSGCGIPVVTELKFNTAGSTNASTDITAAKLYKTGNSTVFNTSNLVATVASPSGAFSFSVVDTILPGDVTNYWLAYDLSGTATSGNTIDARFDSVEAIGTYHLPVVSNPAGSLTIAVPMTYTSSTVTQTASKVSQGSMYSNIIGIEVMTSPTGAPLPINSLDIATTGTTSLSDITNLRVWYTGSSPSFVAATQFGSTLATPAATQTVAGYQQLVNGINYFWVTYDVSVGAGSGNFVDAECASISVNGTPQTPTVTAPAGARQVRSTYCMPAPSGSPNIINVTMGDLNYSPAPLTTFPAYRSFAPVVGATTGVQRGEYLDISVNTNSTCHISVWMDYNDDGVFAADEWNELTTNSSSFTPTVKSIFIPTAATLGQITMRVMIRLTNNPNTDPCRTSGGGEAHDYQINILPQPSPTSYVWNQTGTNSFKTASNWTPARNRSNINDALVFNVGGNITVNNVGNQMVSQVTVANATNVTMTSNGVRFSAENTLDLTSGSIIVNDGSVNLGLGSSATTTGTLTGTGSIDGSFSRWIGTSLAAYTFPMSHAGNARTIAFNYTAAPTVGGKFTVQYRTGDPGSAGLPVVDGALNLVNISSSGIWVTYSDGNLVDGTYSMTVNADNIPSVVDFAQTALLRRDFSGDPWVAAGTLVTTTGTNAAMVLSRTGVTDYNNDFGIAGTAINPLPVTLTKFTANKQSADVLVSWTTSSEINNKGFEVERSVNGHSFEYVGFVKGAGNSSRSLSYSLLDAKAFVTASSNTLYYRLKQIDADGKTTYSQVVKVVNNDIQKAPLAVYPNPFTDKVSVSVHAAEVSSMKVTVADLQGRIVMTESIGLVKGDNEATLHTPANLARGAYFVKTELNGETNTFKLIKSE
jgi:hypothetical protein